MKDSFLRIGCAMQGILGNKFVTVFKNFNEAEIVIQIGTEFTVIEIFGLGINPTLT